MNARLLVTHWQIEPGVTTALVLYGALYLWGVRRAGARWPIRRTLAFMAGLASIVIALESGIDSYDDRLLSVHMTQHMILLMLAPLLLLAGQPVLLALKVLPSARSRRRLARTLRSAGRAFGPVQCLAVFSTVVVLTHLPGFYDAALRHSGLHGLEHVLYLGSGLLLWWPVLDLEPAASRRLGGLGRLIYMLAAMPAMALVGAYLNRHPTLVYPAYAPPAHALGVNPIKDQAQAGAIMWVAGTIVMTAVGLWAAVAALVAEERRQRARERRVLGTGGIT